MKHVGDLLGSLVDRKHIRVQVEAAQLVSIANTFLETILPETRTDDVCAVSIQNGMLVIACTSSASSDFINDHADEIMNAICRKLPRASIERIQTRLVSDMYSHDL